ncbi:MAG: Smr/MutS family protein [Sphingomonas sp.]
MANRPLGPDEAALWARVLATVRPLPGRKAPATPAHSRDSGKPAPPATPPATSGSRPRANTENVRRPTPHHRATLDSGWDKRLSRGLAQPDCTVDLHGHSLATAYARLDAALDQAIAQGDRVMLLVTGKPPRADSERPHARGAIREAVGDWLAASRHADRIAAVRNAHPRHGGQGALYIVLRRPRPLP